MERNNLLTRIEADTPRITPRPGSTHVYYVSGSWFRHFVTPSVYAVYTLPGLGSYMHGNYVLVAHANLSCESTRCCVSHRDALALLAGSLRSQCHPQRFLLPRPDAGNAGTCLD